MSRRPHAIRESIFVGFTVLLLLVALPLAAAAVFTLRVALFVGVAAALMVGTVLALFSPAIRRWLDLDRVTSVSIGGLLLPGDVLLHPAHAWARLQRGEATVGADDLMQAMLGPVDKVVLPPPGTRVAVGEPLFQLRSGRRTLTACAPLRGTVIGSNDALGWTPSLVNDSPYRSGWVVRLRAEGPSFDLRELLDTRRSREWFRSQLDELIGILTPGAPALADGGRVVPDLHAHISDESWPKIRRRFFASA